MVTQYPDPAESKARQERREPDERSLDYRCGPEHREGVGKQGKGALWEVHPQKLLSTVLKALAERSDLKTDEIDDVIMSCSSQFQKQGSCVGRMAALDAGFSTKASGVTLDRFCGGGITAVNLAAVNIMSGMEDLIVAGGVEMMSYTRSVRRRRFL